MTELRLPGALLHYCIHGMALIYLPHRAHPATAVSLPLFAPAWLDWLPYIINALCHRLSASQLFRRWMPAGTLVHEKLSGLPSALIFGTCASAELSHPCRPPQMGSRYLNPVFLAYLPYLTLSRNSAGHLIHVVDVRYGSKVLPVRQAHQSCKLHHLRSIDFRIGCPTRENCHT